MAVQKKTNMIGAVFVGTTDDKCVFIKRFNHQKEYEFPKINTVETNRSLFELNGKSCIFKRQNDLKFFLVADTENQFILKSCLNKFIDTLRSIPISFTENDFNEKSADVHFFLNILFPGGKIADISVKSAIDEYKGFVTSFEKKNSFIATERTSDF